MSILHFYFILTINQQLLTLFCERVATYDSHSVRSHVRTHTAYQKYSCERASKNHVGKDIINFIIEFVLCADVDDATWKAVCTIRSLVVPSLAHCIRFVGHSCGTLAHTHIRIVREFSVTGLADTVAAAAAHSHVNERMKWKNANF